MYWLITCAYCPSFVSIWLNRPKLAGFDDVVGVVVVCSPLLLLTGWKGDLSCCCCGGVVCSVLMSTNWLRCGAGVNWGICFVCVGAGGASVGVVVSGSSDLISHLISSLWAARASAAWASCAICSVLSSAGSFLILSIVFTSFLLFASAASLARRSSVRRLRRRSPIMIRSRRIPADSQRAIRQAWQFLRRSPVTSQLRS